MSGSTLSSVPFEPLLVGRRGADAERLAGLSSDRDWIAGLGRGGDRRRSRSSTASAEIDDLGAADGDAHRADRRCPSGRPSLPAVMVSQPGVSPVDGDVLAELGARRLTVSSAVDVEAFVRAVVDVQERERRVVRVGRDDQLLGLQDLLEQATGDRGDDAAADGATDAAADGAADTAADGAVDAAADGAVDAGQPNRPRATMPATTMTMRYPHRRTCVTHLRPPHNAVSPA